MNVDLLPERVRSRIIVNADGCWAWASYRDGHGYAAMWWEGRMWQGHRLVWRLLVGDFPEGLQADHLCRVRHCVNPAHIEPVTARENTRRSANPPALYARRTHCEHGHEFTPENTLIREGGARRCRECNRERCRREYQDRKAAR